MQEGLVLAWVEAINERELPQEAQRVLRRGRECRIAHVAREAGVFELLTLEVRQVAAAGLPLAIDGTRTVATLGTAVPRFGGP